LGQATYELQSRGIDGFVAMIFPQAAKVAAFYMCATHECDATVETNRMLK
jgi:hypothetical protein